jgi:hypothetical protein
MGPADRRRSIMSGVVAHRAFASSGGVNDSRPAVLVSSGVSAAKGTSDEWGSPGLRNGKDPVRHRFTYV